MTTSIQDSPEKWQVVTDMPYWVTRPATAVVGETIYLLGGSTSTESWRVLSDQETDYIQALDTATMTWDDSVTGTLPPLPGGGCTTWPRLPDTRPAA